MSKSLSENKPAGKSEGKSEQHSQGKATDSSKGTKGPQQVSGNCLSWGCKKDGDRLSFCEEHYDHFKFGLIKKTGEPVPDYEKKYGHYLAYQAKRGSKKVA